MRSSELKTAKQNYRYNQINTQKFPIKLIHYDLKISFHQYALHINCFSFYLELRIVVETTNIIVNEIKTLFYKICDWILPVKNTYNLRCSIIAELFCNPGL